MKKQRQTPKEAFSAHLKELQSTLTRLQQASKKGFRTGTVNPSWADVGDLLHVNELVSEAHDFALGEDEYADIA